MTDLPAEQITLTNLEVTAGSRGRYKIYGEAVNNCATELSAILGVTFYDIDGEVIGRASGSVQPACHIPGQAILAEGQQRCVGSRLNEGTGRLHPLAGNGPLTAR